MTAPPTRAVRLGARRLPQLNRRRLLFARSRSGSSGRARRSDESRSDRSYAPGSRSSRSRRPEFEFNGRAERWQNLKIVEHRQSESLA